MRRAARLQADDILIASGEMRNGLDAAGFQSAGGDQRVHSNASHRAGVDVDSVDLARSHQLVDLLEDAVERKTLGRIDFRADGELPGFELLPEFAFRLAQRDRSRLDCNFDGMRTRVAFRRAKRLDGIGHGANVRRRGAATSSKNADAERGSFAREQREYSRRRFRIDDAVAFALGKAGWAYR